MAAHTTLSALAEALLWEKALELLPAGPLRLRGANVALSACGACSAWAAAAHLLLPPPPLASRAIGDALLARACQRAGVPGGPALQAAAHHWAGAMAQGSKMQLVADTAPVVVALWEPQGGEDES